MRFHDVSWVLHNQPNWTLGQHLNRLTKTLLRNSPEEYNLTKIICTFKHGHVETYEVNRKLDHDQRREMKRYLKKHETELAFFQAQFVNFNQRDNIRFTLSGLAPFEHLDLIGENMPSWMHEMINRKFHQEISWRQKLWSYFYNNRPFRHSLSR